MQEVSIPFECSGCSEKHVVKINLFTHEILGVKPFKKPAGYREKMVLIDFYKKKKGFDQISTWDGTYRGRSMKAATKILHFFRKLDDPVGVGMELIDGVAELAAKQGWDWNIDTCASRAAEWLAEKQK